MSIRDNLDISAYLILGPENTLGRPVADVVRDALDAGFTIVQVRSKVAGARELMECARSVADVIAAAGKSDTVPLLIDDRLDVALACREADIKVDGVHVGQSDMPYPLVKRLLPPGKIIGLSVESREQVLEANAYDVDYIAASPVFATATKTNTLIEWGLEGLSWIKSVSRHPLVAIGGINKGNAEAIFQAGADGIAVVSAIIAASDPEMAARMLKGF